MLSAVELQSVKIISLEQGKERLFDIKMQSERLLFQMQNEGNIADWQKLSNERYELKKAKRNIQHQMGKIVAERHNGRND